MDFNEEGRIMFPFHTIELPPPPYIPKFHHFPLLPTEIRLKIWTFAHPGPRSVIVTLGNHSKRSHQPLSPQPENCLAHLFVNHEARAMFLEHYPRIFTYTSSNKPRGRGGGSYFNFGKDSLCVASGLKGVRYLLRRFPDEMLMVRYLDINVDSHAIHAGRLFSWRNCPLRLTDLPELKLVTLRRLTFAPDRMRKEYAFRGSFANTLEVLQKTLRHQHARKLCEKEKFARLVVQCVYAEGAYLQFRDLFTIIWPLGKDVVGRWEQMDGMFTEESGGVVLRKRKWACRSGEIELHQAWDRSNTDVRGR
jgi:2EXR family